jgi:hypothetical protein
MESPAVELPQRIGVSLSGGGYRAAAFHLGALSYLDRADLLDGVRVLSTVSGGSFTGACYALSLVQGEPFEDFLRCFYGTLRDTHLVEHALRRLIEDGARVPSGRRDLSVAIAEVYSDIFFRDGDAGPHRMRSLIEADIPLERLIINTTEFRTGTVFCFARGGSSGSRTLALSDRDAGAVHADDFHWPGGQVPPEIRDRFTDRDGQPRPIALMDGGIIDNQGVESLLRADRDGEPLDLLIVSDVDQDLADLYPCPSAGDGGGLRLSTVMAIATALVVLCTASTVAVTVEIARSLTTGSFVSVWQAIAAIVPLVLVIAVLVALWWIRHQYLTLVLPLVPQVGRRSRRYLRRLRARQVAEMLSLRLSSLLALTNRIFMRRIRNVGYFGLEHEPSNAARMVPVQIVRLREGRDVPEIPGVPPPSPALRAVATRAAEVPTQLWFDDDRQLPSLVAAGQAAMCYELMRYLLRRHGDRAGLSPAAAALWSRLVDDWAILNSDPYGLVRAGGDGKLAIDDASLPSIDAFRSSVERNRPASMSASLTSTTA